MVKLAQIYQYLYQQQQKKSWEEEDNGKEELDR